MKRPKLKHKHSNHIPKVLKKNIKKLENKTEKLRIGKTHNHRHNGTPGTIQFQRETDDGWLKMKAFSDDGTIDLFVFGDKDSIVEIL